MGEKSGCKIPIETTIGYGLFLHYFNGIYVNSKAVLGDNVNLSHQVTIAKNDRKNGNPILKNNIYVGPGAKIVGDVTIEDGVVIGTNAVVTKSFGPNVTIAGIPAKIINEKNSDDYLCNPWDKK